MKKRLITGFSVFAFMTLTTTAFGGITVPLVKDPLRNKTIVPKSGPGNQFNKFWITPQGRVVWFFVSGAANEGITAEIGKGVTRGKTVLQYDPDGNVVDYAKYKGRIVRIDAPYLARATSNGSGVLNFNYSFTAAHTTKAGTKIEESEMTSMKVDISAGDCKFTANSSNTLTRSGTVIQNLNSDEPTVGCTVTDGNN